MKTHRIEIVSCRVIGNSLKDAMKAAKLTQEITAKRAGNLTSRQLTRFLDGEHCPSLERAVALSVVLGVPVFKLFAVEVSKRKVQGKKITVSVKS